MRDMRASVTRVLFRFLRSVRLVFAPPFVFWLCIDLHLLLVGVYGVGVVCTFFHTRQLSVRVPVASLSPTTSTERVRPNSACLTMRSDTVTSRVS